MVQEAQVAIFIHICMYVCVSIRMCVYMHSFVCIRAALMVQEAQATISINICIDRRVIYLHAYVCIYL